MYAEERRETAIDPAQLGADQPLTDSAHRRRAVALHSVADDVQRGDLRDQLEREFATLPVRVDDRQDLCFAELTHLLQDRDLFLRQLLLHQKVVSASSSSDIVDEFERGGISHWRAPCLLCGDAFCRANRGGFLGQWLVPNDSSRSSTVTINHSRGTLSRTAAFASSSDSKMCGA